MNFLTPLASAPVYEDRPTARDTTVRVRLIALRRRSGRLREAA